MPRIKYKQISPEAFVSITDAASIALDCGSNPLANQKLTTTQTAIAFTFSNFLNGSVLNLSIIKTNTGDTVVSFPDGTSITLSNIVANSYFTITVRYDGANYYITSSTSSLTQAQQFALTAQMFRMFT